MSTESTQHVLTRRTRYHIRGKTKHIRDEIGRVFCGSAFFALRQRGTVQVPFVPRRPEPCLPPVYSSDPQRPMHGDLQGAPAAAAVADPTATARAARGHAQSFLPHDTDDADDAFLADGGGFCSRA